MKVADISRDMPAICKKNRELEKNWENFLKVKAEAHGGLFIYSFAEVAGHERPSYVAIDDDGWVGIDTGQGVYDFDASKIRTYKDILAWVCHLSEKNWMSQKKITEFIHVMCKAKTLPFPTTR